MITPSFGLTATERVLPKLALDFTTASLDSRVTFTRTTGASNPATYINSSGNVTAATNDQPRFDYNPVTLVCKGLLIEESRTNLVYPSSTYTGSWAAVNIGSTSNATTAPDGTVTAEKLIPDATSSVHYYTKGAIFTVDGQNRYWSVYVKAAGYRYVVIGHRTFSSSAYTVIFDTQTGTYTNTGSSTYIQGTLTPVQMPNGWWRIGFLSNYNSAGYNVFNIGVSTDGTIAGATFSGNGTDGIYAWGAQVELGAFATSYIPTTTAALTRNADVATMTGTNFSDWYNQSEGALSCEFAFIGYELANRDRIVSITDATGNEEIGIIQNSTNGYGRFEVVDGGANQALLNCINTTMTAGTTYQICGTYKVNSFCGSGSLGSQATDASGTIPTPDRMCLGGYGPGTTTAIFNGHLKSVNYWPQRITNNETLAFAKI